MGRSEVSFHTAREHLPHNASHIIINQAYVQYTLPRSSEDSHPHSITPQTPILFVHGGGLTGAMWESTPDRRSGWATLASQAPHSRSVYCLDAVDSGRRQRCPDQARAGKVEHRTLADIWRRFRFGLPERFGPDGERTPFPGLQFPLEHLDRLLASQSARRRGGEQYEAEAQGLCDAIDEIGECDLVAHSNGCAVCILALLNEPTKQKVRKLVLIEPGPPHTPLLGHFESVKTLVLWGDHLAGHEVWESIFAHYEKIKGDVTVWELSKMGIKGNSHFPIHDRNSDQIGSMVLNWLDSIP